LRWMFCLNSLKVMHSNFAKFWDSAHHMVDSFFARLPSLILGVFVFFLFYLLSLAVSRVRGVSRDARAPLKNLRTYPTASANRWIRQASRT
jgi:hypothetical protein